LGAPFTWRRDFICIGNCVIQTASDQAFLLMLISVCLGVCFVRAFWKIEEDRRRRERNRALVREARRSLTPGH